MNEGNSKKKVRSSAQLHLQGDVQSFCCARNSVDFFQLEVTQEAFQSAKQLICHFYFFFFFYIVKFLYFIAPNSGQKTKKIAVVQNLLISKISLDSPSWA